MQILKFVCVLYRPPNSSADFFVKLERNIDAVTLTSNNIVILGDFNCNMSVKNSLSQKIHDLCTFFQFDQIIQEPTRITPNSRTCIDLIMLPKFKQFARKGVISLGVSDHSLVYVNLKDSIVRKKPFISKCRSFRKFCIDDFLREGENMSWENIYEITDIESAWSYFQLNFITLCDKHAPFISVRKKSVKTPWINKEYIELARQRDYLKFKFNQTHEDSYWNEFQKMRNRVNNLNKYLKKKYFTEEFTEHVGDCSNTWKTLKRLTNNKKSHCVELRNGGVVVTDATEISNEFNRFFTRGGANPLNNSSEFNLFTNKSFIFTEVTCEFVQSELLKLDSRKSCGLDNLHPYLLKIATPFISKPLTYLFNLSLNSATVPIDWKKAKVTPVFKNGKKDDINNYRPISVICHLMKILEKAVHKQVYDYFTSNHLLSHCQSGFRPLHSTTTVLLDLNEYVLRNIDGGFVTARVFIFGFQTSI